jgi:HPt (histidine-containing phosphotransfer) domain-containing protein
MSEPTEAAKAQLEKLRRRYGLSLPEKISAIQVALASLLAGPWEEQACQATHRQVHSLAGSSGTFGYPEISRVARAAEILIQRSLEARAVLPVPQRAEVEELVSKLRELAAGVARQGSP